MPKIFKIELREKIKVNSTLKLHGKSGKIDNREKPIWEVKQYVGTKDSNVIARYDIARIAGVIKVFQSLWRMINGGLKIVHSHWKR